MKLFKKNQVVIYVIALMLVVAGYLNFTANGDLNSAVQTASSEEELDKMANIGDAQLVSSNPVSEENITVENQSSTSNSISEINILENNKIADSSAIPTSNDVSKNNKDYFSASKLDRDNMYSQMLETYENILNSNNSLETQKQSSSEEIKKINNVKNSIMICENLIKTKGFDDVVIFVNGESVSVIVEDEQLDKEEVAKVQNIVSRELNAKVENIHISNK